MPTMHKIIHNCIEPSSSHRICAFGESTSLSELHEQVLVETDFGSICEKCALENRFSSMSKALSGARLVGRAQGVGTSRSIWIFKWFDLYAYPCFYCCNYFASATDVRTHILDHNQTHILADHIRQQPFSITIKKQSSIDDDDG
jgi:hypothetical protein